MSLGAAGRRHHLRRSVRRVVSALVRGRLAELRSGDAAVNARNLLFGLDRGHCPVCGYSGTFLQYAGRRRQICPSCESRSRHRVIFRALADRRPEPYVLGLHIAPEACLTPILETYGEHLLTGDLEPGVGASALDLRALPIRDGALDFFFASHVMEHVDEDRRALSEIYRVLRPGGLAILVVPITAEATVEFGEVRADLNFHARDCGPDYFERYTEAGFEVDLVRSDELEGKDEQALTTLDNGREVVHWIPFCRKPSP